MKRMLMGASWCAWLSVAWLVPGCGDGADMLVDASTDAGSDASTSDGSIDLGGDGGGMDDLGPLDGFVGVAPTAVADAYEASSGFTLSVPAAGVLANDALGDPTAVVSSFGGGSLGGAASDLAAGAVATVGTGSLVVRADGSVDFTPDTGFVGAFTVDYVITNAVGTSSATVTIEVSAGPTAIDDSYDALADTTFEVLGGTVSALVANDLGAPAPTVVSFGGGDLGGTVDDHAAGSTASFGTTGSLTVDADGGVEFVPEPGFSGEFTFDYVIMNALGSSTGTVTISVQSPPTLAGTPPDAEVGAAYVFDFTVGGYPAPTLTLTAGTLPPGMALVGAQLTGAPTMAGLFDAITVSASNGIGSAATVTFAIDVREGPAITSGNTATLEVGSAASFAVTATGRPAPMLSSMGALPAGVTFDNGTPGGATLTGTPQPGTGGVYTPTLTASNGFGTNATQALTVTVNEAPSVSGAPANGAVNVAYLHSFTVGGFPAPTLGLTAGTLPPGLSLSGNGITGTPTMAGTFSGLTVTASNGVGSPATLDFSITVNSPPAITSAASTTFVVGTMGSFAVTATGTPTPNITRTGALPTGVTFAGGVLSGTPGAGTGGTYPLTFTASNGVGSNAVQSFTLTVNQAPTVSGAPPSGTVSTSYNHTFTVAGFPAPTLSLTAGTLPPGLSLSGNSITGSPTMAGTFSGLTVTASNGVGSPATLDFSITVAGNPVAVADAYGVTGNISVSVPAPGVLGNDTLSGATLTHVGPAASTTTAVPGTITTSNGGTVTLQANGSFTYNPPAGYTGTDAFHYRLTSGGNTTTAQVTLSITNRVWFVDSTASAGDGRLSSPRNNLATAMSGAAPGDRIFVYRRASNYVTNVTLQANQRLIGQGVALDATSLGFTPAPFSVTLPGATTHTGIQGSVTFGGANAGLFGVHVTPSSGGGVTDGGVGRTGLVASDVRVTTSGGIGVSLTGSSGNLSFRSVSTTGGTRGISLSGVGGTFTVTGDGSTAGSGGTIQNTTAHGVQLTNVSAAVSFSHMAFNGSVYDNVSLETSGAGVKLDASGSVASSLTIDRCSFASNQGRAVYIHPTGSGATAFTLTNSTFPTNLANTSEVMVFYEGSSNANTYDIRGNTFTNVNITAVQVFIGTSVGAQQTARGHVSNNNITGLSNGFATGISVGVTDNAGSTMIVAVENNMFTAMGTMAIDLNKQPLNNNMHVTVRNNTVRSPVLPGTNYLYGLRLTMASSSSAGPAGTYCANVTGNDIPDFGGGSAIRIRRLGTHAGLTTSIQGFTGNTQSQLTTFLNNNNAGPLGPMNYSPDPLTQFAFPNQTCLTP